MNCNARHLQTKELITRCQLSLVNCPLAIVHCQLFFTTAPFFFLYSVGDMPINLENIREK